MATATGGPPTRPTAERPGGKSKLILTSTTTGPVPSHTLPGQVGHHGNRPTYSRNGHASSCSGGPRRTPSRDPGRREGEIKRQGGQKCLPGRRENLPARELNLRLPRETRSQERRHAQEGSQPIVHAHMRRYPQGQTRKVLQPAPGAVGGGGAAMEERFEASMVLAGVGDAIGYCNGEWEFCRSGELIHEEVRRRGGILSLEVAYPQWIVSDDTVLHMATASALVSRWHTHEDLYRTLASSYKKSWSRMAGRAPGLTCEDAIRRLNPREPRGWEIPFNPRGGGCGAAMRAVPIGLLYWRPGQLQDLVAVAIESGRMTHNHPTGYLGALATALFVSYAIQGRPLREWGRGLVDSLELAIDHVRRSGRDERENRSNWNYFENQWLKYMKDRRIVDGKSEPQFPARYGVRERDHFYRSLSYSGTGGASGHDAPMIAYDALLGCGGSWAELCSRSMLHGGDSDSTGIIAAACWGAMWGYEGVAQGHHHRLEYRSELVKLARQLYQKSLRMSV